MKNKKIIIIMGIIIVILVGIIIFLLVNNNTGNEKSVETDATRFAEEYTSVDENNRLKRAAMDDVSNALEDGTGVVKI